MYCRLFIGIQVLNTSCVLLVFHLSSYLSALCIPLFLGATIHQWDNPDKPETRFRIKSTGVIFLTEANMFILTGTLCPSDATRDSRSTVINYRLIYPLQQVMPSPSKRCTLTNTSMWQKPPLTMVRKLK